MHNRLKTRSASDPSLENLQTRSMSVRSASSTYDDKARSVRVIAVTENPVSVFDYDRYERVNEILLISGMELPENGQLPLLDCHYRHSVDDVYGSARDFTPTEVNGIPASETGVFFADDAKGRDLEGKVRDGHVTDFSIGYLIYKSHSYYIPEGQKQFIEGREFEGPVIVRTKWMAKELSATPIGADEAAKARSDSTANNQHKGDEPMPAELKQRQQEAALAERTRINAIRTRALSKGIDEENINGMIERGLSVEDADAHIVTLLGQRSTEADSLSPDDVKKREDDAALAERTRIGDIRKRGLTAGLDEAVIDDMIGRGLSLGDAALEIVDTLEKRQAPAMGAGRIEMGEDERDKFRAAAMDGFCMRAGLTVEKPAPGHESFRGRTLLRLAEECIVRSGGSVTGMSNTDIALGAMGLGRRSMGGGHTSDFSLLMGDLAHRVLLDAYNAAPVTWQIWCPSATADDFKDMHSINLSEFKELQLLNEKGEYHEVYLKEFGENYAVKTFGNVFKLTRQMVINDNLRAFTSVPKKFGNASRRTVNNHVYRMLSETPKMAFDNKDLYSTARKTLVEGAGLLAPPSTDTLSEMRRLMRSQVEPGSTAPTNNMIKFLLAGSKHETNVDVVLNSVGMPAENMSVGVKNPFGDGRIVPVIDATMDMYDPDAWYTTCDPNQADFMEVSFLNGEQEPYLDSTEDWDSDAIKHKCRLDFGVGRTGTAVVKNPGK